MSRQRLARVLMSAATVPLGFVAVAGCTSAGAQEPASPAKSSATPLNTVARADVGAELTVTASVERVITVDAFVVGDQDLPAGGLLVFGVARPGLRPTDLVTVRGAVERFGFSTFAPRFALSDAERYRTFDGHKVLIAEEIRSYA